MILSLFSGCGALDLGFEQAGFEIGLAYDIRPSSIASWNHNRPDTPNGRISDLTAIRLADIDNDFGGRFVPTGIIGGPPCQSFSRANHSRSHNDPRSRLIRKFFDLALRFHRHREPLEFILMENVSGLASADGGELLDKEIKRLRKNDFQVNIFYLDAVCHSVPQYRRRLFLLALSNSITAVSKWTEPSCEEKKTTVGQAIKLLPAPTFFRKGLKEGDILFHPNHWCMVPKSPRFFNNSLKSGFTSGRSFKTLSWDAPSVTVSYGHREVHIHPDGKRRLSVFEAMRLQGFPDDYILKGNLSEQIDQVSEAVPPPLAQAVALSIASVVRAPPALEEHVENYPSISCSTSSL